VYNEKPFGDEQRNCRKHVEFQSKNKFEKLLHLVCFIVIMRFIAIVVFVLVSGSCYNGRGASNFDTLNTSKST
jgi:hypothetical protein